MFTSRLVKLASAATVLGATGYQLSDTTSVQERMRVTFGQLFGTVHAASAAAPALSSKEFQSFKLESVKKLTHNTAQYTFALQTPTTPLGLSVASFVLAKAVVDGKPVERPYTPVSPLDEVGKVDFIIKSYEKGVMSKHFASLKPGDTIDLKGPIRKIEYKPNMKKEIGMIAGGTGITPMLQVARNILSNPEDKTKVSLVFANVAEEDIILRKELDTLAQQNPKKFSVYYVLEKPPQGWKHGVGYVNEDIVKSNLPAPSADSLIMVCGPPPMMEAISGNKNMVDYSQGELKGLLKKLGYTSDTVFKF